MPELLTRLDAAGTDELGSLHRDLLEPPAHDGRPHVALNFVMTADGRVSYRGRAEIGTRTDRALMVQLRSLADAVMIGAGTLRVDPFAPSIPGRDRQPQRGAEVGQHRALAAQSLRDAFNRRSTSGRSDGLVRD